MEDLREEKLTDWVVKVQAVSRGCLGRKSYDKLKVIFFKQNFKTKAIFSWSYKTLRLIV